MLASALWILLMGFFADQKIARCLGTPPLIGMILVWIILEPQVSDVLSILTTPPIGVWGVPIFAPKLLERGEVAPTKVTMATRTVLLAAVDASPFPTEVLTKVASLAPLSDGEVIVLNVINVADAKAVEQLRDNSIGMLRDLTSCNP